MELRTELLKTLCSIQACSGDESRMSEFILRFVQEESAGWKVQPQIHAGKGFQDCIVLAFGKPRTAVFAHMDNIGFTARYRNELIKIGGPVCNTGIHLIGSDSQGEIRGTLSKNSQGGLRLKADRIAEPGTRFCFEPHYRESRSHVQCAYLDNRLGVYAALELARNLENGIIAFTCWEEHGGGSVGYLADFITRKYQVFQALISDITWVTEGVKAGKGAVISLRDSGIPRQGYLNRILELARKSGIPFQCEVEASGGSDGSELQKSPFPIDWCFIGAPEKNVHSPDEQVHKADIQSMISLYQMLMHQL